MKIKRSGFTLVELVVSFTILTFVVSGILTLFTLGLNISTSAGRMTTHAVLAERLMEEIRSGGFGSHGGPVPGWHRDLHPRQNLDPAPPYFSQPTRADNQPGTGAPEAYCGIWDDNFDGINDYPDYFWLAYLEIHPDGNLTDLIKVTLYIFNTDARAESTLLGPGYRQEEFVTYITRYW